MPTWTMSLLYLHCWRRISPTAYLPQPSGPAQKPFKASHSIWEIANQQKRLDAIILEVAFPKRLQGMADLSRHLTPKTFGLELAKLENHNPAILALHLKPLMRSTIINELHKMNLERLVVMRSDHEYCYPS